MARRIELSWHFQFLWLVIKALTEIRHICGRKLREPSLFFSLSVVLFTGVMLENWGSGEIPGVHIKLLLSRSSDLFLENTCSFYLILVCCGTSKVIEESVRWRCRVLKRNAVNSAVSGLPGAVPSKDEPGLAGGKPWSDLSLPEFYSLGSHSVRVCK